MIIIEDREDDIVFTDENIYSSVAVADHSPPAHVAVKVNEHNPIAEAVLKREKEMGPFKQYDTHDLFKGLPVLGPFKYSDGSTYEGQYWKGMRHGIHKSVDNEGTDTSYVYYYDFAVSAIFDSQNIYLIKETRDQVVPLSFAYYESLSTHATERDYEKGPRIGNFTPYGYQSKKTISNSGKLTKLCHSYSLGSGHPLRNTPATNSVLPGSFHFEDDAVTIFTVKNQDYTVLGQSYSRSDDSYYSGSLYIQGWNCKHGHGIMTDACGNQFEGEWHENQLSDGVARYTDGSVYHGEFSDLKKHGYGRLELPDGTEQFVYWQDDMPT
jgi:hypothetical protein